ncbi:hypothetical protein [Burkholderia phage BCSR5]|nr:hypothetical protein [Burkholderia phage BCSR5]
MTVPTYKEAKDAMRKAGIQGVTDGDNWTGQDNGLFQVFARNQAYLAGEVDNPIRDQAGFAMERVMTPSVSKAIGEDPGPDPVPKPYEGVFELVPIDATLGAIVTGTLTGTIPEDEVIIDWNDGSVPVAYRKGDPITHQYMKVGKYAPFCTVVLGEEQVKIVARTVVDVTDPTKPAGPVPYTATLTLSPANPKVGDLVTGVLVENKPSDTISVNWGDGGVDYPAGTPITHTYTAAGSYTVTAGGSPNGPITVSPTPYVVLAVPIGN